MGAKNSRDTVTVQPTVFTIPLFDPKSFVGRQHRILILIHQYVGYIQDQKALMQGGHGSQAVMQQMDQQINQLLDLQLRVIEKSDNYVFLSPQGWLYIQNRHDMGTDNRMHKYFKLVLHEMPPQVIQAFEAVLEEEQMTLSMLQNIQDLRQQYGNQLRRRSTYNNRQGRQTSPSRNQTIGSSNGVHDGCTGLSPNLNQSSAYQEESKRDRSPITNQRTTYQSPLLSQREHQVIVVDDSSHNDHSISQRGQTVATEENRNLLSFHPSTMIKQDSKRSILALASQHSEQNLFKESKALTDNQNKIKLSRTKTHIKKMNDESDESFKIEPSISAYQSSLDRVVTQSNIFLDKVVKNRKEASESDKKRYNVIKNIGTPNFQYQAQQDKYMSCYENRSFSSSVKDNNSFGSKLQGIKMKMNDSNYVPTDHNEKEVNYSVEKVYFATQKDEDIASQLKEISLMINNQDKSHHQTMVKSNSCEALTPKQKSVQIDKHAEMCFHNFLQIKKEQKKQMLKNHENKDGLAEYLRQLKQKKQINELRRSSTANLDIKDISMLHQIIKHQKTQQRGLDVIEEKQSNHSKDSFARASDQEANFSMQNTNLSHERKINQVQLKTRCKVTVITCSESEKSHGLSSSLSSSSSRTNMRHSRFALGQITIENLNNYHRQQHSQTQQDIHLQKLGLTQNSQGGNVLSPYKSSSSNNTNNSKQIYKTRETKYQQFKNNIDKRRGVRKVNTKVDEDNKNFLNYKHVKNENSRTQSCEIKKTSEKSSSFKNASHIEETHRSSDNHLNMLSKGYQSSRNSISTPNSRYKNKKLRKLKIKASQPLTQSQREIHFTKSIEKIQLSIDAILQPSALRIKEESEESHSIRMSEDHINVTNAQNLLKTPPIQPFVLNLNEMGGNKGNQGEFTTINEECQEYEQSSAHISNMYFRKSSINGSEKEINSNINAMINKESRKYSQVLDLNYSNQFSAMRQKLISLNKLQSQDRILLKKQSDEQLTSSVPLSPKQPQKDHQLLGLDQRPKVLVKQLTGGYREKYKIGHCHQSSMTSSNFDRDESQEPISPSPDWHKLIDGNKNIVNEDTQSYQKSKMSKNLQTNYIFTHDFQGSNNEGKRLIHSVQKLRRLVGLKETEQVKSFVESVLNQQLTTMVGGRIAMQFEVKITSPSQNEEKIKKMIQTLQTQKESDKQEECQKQFMEKMVTTYKEIKQKQQYERRITRRLTRQKSKMSTNDEVVKKTTFNIEKPKHRRSIQTPKANFKANKLARNLTDFSNKIRQQVSSTNQQENPILNFSNSKPSISKSYDSQDYNVFEDYDSEEQEYDQEDDQDHSQIDINNFSKYELIELKSRQTNNSFSLLHFDNHDESSTDLFQLNSSITPSPVHVGSRANSIKSGSTNLKFNSKNLQKTTTKKDKTENTERSPPNYPIKKTKFNKKTRLKKHEHPMKLLTSENFTMQDCYSRSASGNEKAAQANNQNSNRSTVRSNDKNKLLPLVNQSNQPLDIQNPSQSQSLSNGNPKKIHETNHRRIKNQTFYTQTSKDHLELNKFNTQTSKDYMEHLNNSQLISSQSKLNKFQTSKIPNVIVECNNPLQQSNSSKSQISQFMKYQKLESRDMSDDCILRDMLEESKEMDQQTMKESKSKSSEQQISSGNNIPSQLQVTSPQNRFQRTGYVKTPFEHIKQRTNMPKALSSTHNCDYLNPFQGSLKSKKSSEKESQLSRNSLAAPSLNSRKIASSEFRSQYTISTCSCISKKRGGKKQINQYIILSQIGKGNFAKVKKIINKDTRQTFAMKVINKTKLNRRTIGPNKTIFTQIEKEVAIMKKISHPFILKLIEVIDDPNNDKQYLIQEFVEHGDLQSKIHKAEKEPFTEKQCKQWLRQLLYAVWYCHEVIKIFHRDIKPENILLDKEDNIKLSDFGVSFAMENDNEELDGNAGSDCYFSPESTLFSKYNGKQADLWACGVTLYQLVFGSLPFHGDNRVQLYERITRDKPTFNKDKCILKDCADFDKIVELLQGMLMKDPKQRITIQQLATNQWLTDGGTHMINWKDDYEYTQFDNVTADEMANAVTGLQEMKNVYFKKK